MELRALCLARLGVQDSRIVLMLADDWAGDARNPFPGTVFGSAHRTHNLFPEDVQARPQRCLFVAGTCVQQRADPVCAG